MPTFPRSHFTELQITLTSNEVLGILSSDYLEDYFGVDNQITLRHESGTRYSVLMNEVISETPSIPHDVFTGYASLSVLPDGDYFIEGRVRDIAGNYTILGAVDSPIGNERLIVLSFTVTGGADSNVVVLIGPIRIMGIVGMDAVLLPSPQFVTTILPDFVMDSVLQENFIDAADIQPALLDTIRIQPIPTF
jgi:hypothetical protein